MSLAPPASLRLAPAIEAPRATHAVVDLFSGAGGMSCGFHRHPAFAIAGAADAQVGKPSSPAGTLGCNASYARNIGIEPLAVDLATIEPEDLRDRLALPGRPVVLAACAPCTGFSRTLARNHLVDDARNSVGSGRSRASCGPRSSSWRTPASCSWAASPRTSPPCARRLRRWATA